MGALAVSLGIMAVVGANWEDIPAWLKLAVAFALNGLAAASVFVFWQRDRVWLREISALLLFALVLSAIALIGQVYQLQSAPWRALALWLVLTTPFLALTAFTRLNGVLWLLAVVVTWFMADKPIEEFLTRLGVLPKHDNYAQSGYLDPLMSYVAASVMIVFAAIRGRWARAQSQASVLLNLSLAGMVVSCSVWISFDTYGAVSTALIPIAVAALVTVPAALALWHCPMDLDPRLRLAFLAGSLVVWAVGLGLFDEHGMAADLLRALLFILYWAGIGAAAARMGRRGWFGFAFTVIGLRLLILYFQAIGGLTATGLGLIGGGILCLGLAALGWRLTRTVGRRPAGAAA